MSLASDLLLSLLGTLRSVAPIVVMIVFFQGVILRRPITNPLRTVVGMLLVVLGLALFLVGLDWALFPLGKSIAAQLTAAEFVGLEAEGGEDAESRATWLQTWSQYYWTYAFAFAIGFCATIAEPALLAVAMKAHEVSGGSLSVLALRVAVALGAGFGVMLGTFRIVSGIPLPYFILTGYVLVMIQTWFAPKEIVPLAYDSGGVTTSTVTVPLVAALGLGLAASVPGRNPLVDGFGMIALTVLFPMITVMGYAQLARWWNRAPA